MELAWDDVRVVMALLHTRSLAGAARRLGLDRSTVSRRVGALERALDQTLFLRTREGLRPAAALERLRPQLERIDADMRALVELARRGDDPLADTVRIATTEALAGFLVERGLLEACTQHPGLAIELLGGNRPLDLARGEADLALRLRGAREASLRSRSIARIEVALFAAPAYLQRRGLPRGDDDLAGHDVLVPGGELAALPEARWLASRAGVRVVLRTSSMPALLAAAHAGLGLAPLSRPWAELDPGLQLVAPLPKIPARPLWLVLQPEAARRPAVRMIADRIARIFGQPSPPRRPARG
ncbi:MAG: LysR family transcriptional regulator [Nannocystaceae bacterium]|nr:LysR family transcriptional regulator [Nannocystaceae bacterium]